MYGFPTRYIVNFSFVSFFQLQHTYSPICAVNAAELQSVYRNMCLIVMIITKHGVVYKTYKRTFLLSSRGVHGGVCQTPSKTQTDKGTNGQTPGIEFGAF